MNRHFGPVIFCAVILLSGCNRNDTVAAPSAQEPTQESTTEFCGMELLGHPGPKGQIFLAGRKTPLWFSSVRDAVAFTLLPEEPKDIAAIYVNDMGRASWNAPEAGTWVEARHAWYVIGSSRAGGMGGAETVPFAEKAAAEDFARHYRGRVVAFKDIPPDYVLGSDDKSPAQPADPAASRS